MTKVATLVIVAATAFVAGAWAQGAVGRAELDRVIQEQFSALNAKNIAKFEATLTDDVMKMQDDLPLIRGRAMLVKGFQQALTANAFSQMQGTTIDGATSGDLGYALYTGSNLDAKGAKQVWHGVSVLKRIDGKRKIAVDASMSVRQ